MKKYRTNSNRFSRWRPDAEYLASEVKSAVPIVAPHSVAARPTAK